MNTDATELTTGEAHKLQQMVQAESWSLDGEFGSWLSRNSVGIGFVVLRWS
jgi:hypothetical protein